MTTAEIKAELMRAREAERAYRLARDKASAYGQLLARGKTVRFENDGSTHERKGNPVENAYCKCVDYDMKFTAPIGFIEMKASEFFKIIEENS